MKRPPETPLYAALFILAAAVFLTAAYRLLLSEKAPQGFAQIEPLAGEEHGFNAFAPLPEGGGDTPHDRVVYFYRDVIETRRPKSYSTVPEEVVESVLEMPKPSAPDFPAVRGGAKVAIIIDDMGVDRARSFEMIKLEAPLTLAFLPYVNGLAGITDAARHEGHELMIHMPMQPMNDTLDIGGIGLKVDMDEAELGRQLDLAFDAFDGYAGLNNHMGSRLTQDAGAMAYVLERVKARGLYFIDSKTISTSVAGGLARLAGLRTAERDVFLDHEESAEFVAGALERLERRAYANGSAIAIGHPKDVTIEGLKAWLPTLEEKGIELVHASDLVRVYSPEELEDEMPLAEGMLINVQAEEAEGPLKVSASEAGAQGLIEEHDIEESAGEVKTIPQSPALPPE